MGKVIIIYLLYLYLYMSLSFNVIMAIDISQSNNSSSSYQSSQHLLDKIGILKIGSLSSDNTQNKNDLNLRIFVKLIPYTKVVFLKNNHQTDYVVRQLKGLNHILRANLKETNNFYISNIHIETIPVTIDLKTNKYQLKMRFFSILDDSIDFEELIGFINVKGILYKDKEQVFNLYSNISHTFVDKNNTPVLTVHVGPQQLNLVELKKFFGNPYSLSLYTEVE